MPPRLGETHRGARSDHWNPRRYGEKDRYSDRVNIPDGVSYALDLEHSEPRVARERDEPADPMQERQRRKQTW